MSIKLSDLHYILHYIMLITASRRAAGNLLPWPRSLAAHADDLPKAVSALLRRKLIAEVEVDSARKARRTKSGKRLGLIITDAGRAALDEEIAPEAPVSLPAAVTQTEPPSAPSSPILLRPGTKLALLIDLLKGEAGASLAEMSGAAGWLPHTTRAALSGLRKKGFDVVTET